MECTQCGSPVDQGSAFCPQCGAPTGARSPESAPVGDGQLRGLLTQAQLHKSRREYPQAIAKCMEVLEQQPGDSAACSLLGDIEHAQRHLREALEWYKQAVAADPSNVADRRKLDEVMERVYVTGAGAPVSGAQTRSGGRGLPWVPVVIASAALAVIVIAVVGWLRLTSSPGVSVDMAPRSAASRAPSPGPRVPTSAPPSGPPAPAGAPAATASTGFLDERERRAAEAAGAALQGREPAVSVAAVFIRPDNNQIELTLNLAAPPSIDPRTSVLRAALLAVQAANRSEAALRSFSLRVRAPISDASGGSHSEVVFMGEVAAVAVADRDIGTLSAGDAEALFTQAWWRPGWAAPGASGPPGATESRS